MLKDWLKNILKIFWVLPIRNNRIIFRSTHGTKYNCNPKYICEYLQKKYPGTLEIVWLFDREGVEKHKYLKKNNYKIVNQKSLKGIIFMMTSKIIVDNHGVISYVPLRKKQVVINTWHGGGSYKKEYSESTDEHKKYMKMMYERTDVFLSSCKKFSECNLEFLYRNNPKKIFEVGMPRNDIFWYGDDYLKKKIKKKLGIIEEKKVVLYAPTFRYDANTDIYMIDSKVICDACKKRFGGDFVFATRFHPFVEKRYMEKDDNDIFVTNWYEDMQEILFITDVLISDYSSCFWDASLSYIPSFIYAADLNYYCKKRNFHTPIIEWPFLLAESETELVDNIINFDDKDYRKKVDLHHKELGSFEKGNASEKIGEYIVKLINV